MPLIEHLKSIRPDISTVMFTGFSEKVDERRALELGLDAFIMKPLTISEISRTIRGTLDRNRAQSLARG